MNLSSRLTNEEAAYESLNKVQRKNGVLFVGMIFLLMGCHSPTANQVSKSDKLVVPPNPMAEQAVVVARQPMGYEVNMAGGTLVVITNGPNKGSQIFFGTTSKPTWTTLHAGTVGKPITVQGSNDLQSWNDLYTTNAPDFYFKFDPKYLFYRTKS